MLIAAGLKGRYEDARNLLHALTGIGIGRFVKPLAIRSLRASCDTMTTMQRHTPDGVILACDFCGTDWDMIQPMIEGHRGSILCLPCLARAIDQAGEWSEGFSCTMCRREFEAGEKAYRPTAAVEQANPQAIVCWDCVRQADRAFASDPDTDWQRKIAPDKRWQ